MAVISLELVAILTAAFLVRALNKFPPFYERMLVGLKFFWNIDPRFVARYYDEYRTKLNDVSALAAASTAYDGALAGTKAHSIAYSHFPHCAFPWNNIIFKESASLILTTAAYGMLGYAAGSFVEIITGSPFSANVDVMLVAVTLTVLVSPLQHITLLGFKHSESVLTAVMGVLGFIASMAVIHSPESLRLMEFPVSRALADISGAVAAPVALAANATGEAVDADTEDAVQAQGLRYMNVSAPQPDHPEYFVASIALSMCVGLIIALLYSPVTRIVRTYLSTVKYSVNLAHSTSAELEQIPASRLISWSQRAVAHLLLATPLAVTALFLPQVFGDANVVPANAVPCTENAILRDCIRNGDGLERIQISAGTAEAFPFVYLHAPQSAWLGFRLASVLVLALFFVSQIRVLLQGFLAEVRNKQAISLANLAASSVLTAAEPTKAKEGAQNMSEELPMPEDLLVGALRHANISATRAASEVSHALTQLMLWPVLTFLLAALTAHRGHIGLGVSAGLHRVLLSFGVQQMPFKRATAPQGGLPGLNISDAVDTLFGDGTSSLPLFRILGSDHGLSIALYILTFIAAFVSILSFVLLIFYEHMYPVLVTAASAGSKSEATPVQRQAAGAVGKESKKKK